MYKFSRPKNIVLKFIKVFISAKYVKFLWLNAYIFVVGFVHYLQIAQTIFYALDILTVDVLAY